MTNASIFRAANQPERKSEAARAEAHHDTMSGMNDMAGLVLMINVKAATLAPVRPAARNPRKIELVIEPNAADTKSPTFACSMREGKKIVASKDQAQGPPIVLMRGEPTEITVVNHLDQPTTIHWHGLELDSYYDGVVGGGDGNQITPAIQPGITAVEFQQFQSRRQKAWLQRVKSLSNAAFGRPQRKPSRSRFLGAAAAYPAAVAPAHGFLGHASDDFCRDAVTGDRLPARGLHRLGLRRRPEYRRLRRRL